MNKDKMLKLYRQMFLLRQFDEMCLQLKRKDLIMNGFHPYSGEEAVAVGVCSALNPDDVVLSTHRPQGHSIAKGSTPRQIFCEMLGRRGGVSQGIGGPMQWIDAPNNFFCGSIVGSGITIAAGVALAMKREGKARVGISFFGDGASNTGSFHEGLNLAAIWKLPVVYICENNQYGEAMPVREFVSAYPISKRAAAYGLEGVTVDGNDIEAVVAAVEKGIAEARSGDGPVFIEAVTYRTRGHYGGDPEYTYRTKEEVASWQRKCPIARFKARLLEEGIEETSLDALESEVIRELEADQAWALEQPLPTVEQATDHVMIPHTTDLKTAAALSAMKNMKVITYCEALREAYREEMQRDSSVYLIGEDVGRWGNLFGASKGLLQEFGPEQVKDAPISEAAIAGCAVGSAVMGMRPIAEIMYIDFISIAMDQIVNHACKYHQLSCGQVKVPVVFRTQGGVGMCNSSQHSQSLENWFVNVPGLIVAMPSTPYDMKGLLKSAIRNDNPVIVIEHKSLYFTEGKVPEEEYLVPLGIADVKREGRDVTIIATSWMVLHALAAAEKLAKEGISCEVVDPRTLWPLDKETLVKSVAKTKRCVVVTEAPAEGGWSAEATTVVTQNCFDELKKPVKRVCGMRTAIPYGKDLEKAVVPNDQWIMAGVHEVLK